jgi:hypothetical protein
MRTVGWERWAFMGFLAAATSGCQAWRVESVSPREVLSRPEVTAVRVTTTDTLRAAIEIYDPVLVGDSISGHPTQRAVARVFVPVRNVRTIATRRRHLGKTLLFGLGIAGGVAVYALLQELNTY